MKHSIISWDCTFRNFHHLIDGLLAQNVNRDTWELIFVEQRTKRYANTFNRNLGLLSLWDRYENVSQHASMKVIYLGDSYQEPYHVGRCLNAGIKVATGDVISVMDGDQLMPRDFLRLLTEYHDTKMAGIACLARHMADRPAGADFRNWTKASFEIEDVLRVCPYGRDPYPINTQVPNYGPMVSARQGLWKRIGGFDEHIVWSGSATMVISDACKRLEMVTGSQAELLMGTYAVHPWHPPGWGRERRAKKDKKVAAYLDLQRRLMAVTMQPDWHERTEMADELYQAHQKLVDSVIKAEVRALRKTYQNA